MIALLEARRAGLYARQHWLPNLVAGVIVGVVALPLAMAFAIASGVRPASAAWRWHAAFVCRSIAPCSTMLIRRGWRVSST